tara:strand:- start:263 stop:622 length:360 start_codon:yes stop_codon:yes gene_type:complete
MSGPFKMKGSPMARNFNIGAESPVKQVGLVKLAVKYGKKVYKAIKGTKPKANNKTSTTRTNADGKSTTTVNKTNGKTTSEATRTSWPSVKPGSKSMHSGTTTNAGGKVTAWDPTKRQVL